MISKGTEYLLTFVMLMGFFFPAQTAGTVAASWVAGKRTKGGMATLWNMELIIISDTLC